MIKLPKLCEKFIYEWFNRNKSVACERFSDTGDTFQGRGVGVVISSKPSDFIVVDKGYTFFAEVKSTNNARGVTTSLFEQQRVKRDKFLKAGASYSYFVFSTVRNAWYTIPANVIVENANRTWDELSMYKNFTLTDRWRTDV